MNALIRRRALAATAKIALGLTVGGCAAEVTHTEVTDFTDDDETYPTSPDTDYPTSPYVPYETELMCQAPAPPQVVALDDNDQLRCCADGLVPQLPETGDEWNDWLTIEDADIDACCRVVTHHVDANGDLLEAEISWELFSACCSHVDEPVLACTPWGPPVPPALRGGLPWLEVA